MIKFRIENGKLELDPKILLIDCFSKIYSWDIENIRYIKYVFFVKDIEEDNPFAHLDPEDKIWYAKRECFRNSEHEFSEEEIPVIEEAMELYEKGNEFAQNRLVHTYDKTIDLMRKQLEAVPPELIRQIDTNGKVLFVDNFKVHADCLINIGKIEKAKEETMARVRKEREKGEVRGDKEIGILARGAIKGKRATEE
jgi:hypothetical protein